MLENTEWVKKRTIQRNWQHRKYKKQDTLMLENTEGIVKKDNPEKLATQEKQDTGQINVREYRRGNDKGQFRKKWQHRVYKTQDK